MKDSVKKHMLADVEVGSFLSSGIDSSYLVALSRPDKTYTVGYKIDKYNEICNEVNVAVGNTFVTDIIDVEKYDYILTCGPTPMMEKLVKMTEGTNTKIMVSLENHMACGVGA